MDIDLGKEFDTIFEDYKREVSHKISKGLDKAAEVLANDYNTSSLTPDDPNTTKNKYKGSFIVKPKKYTGVRYVGSTKTVKGGNSDSIPLSNILEIDQPHIRPIFDSSMDKLAAIVTNELIN